MQYPAILNIIIVFQHGNIIEFFLSLRDIILLDRMKIYIKLN